MNAPLRRTRAALLVAAGLCAVCAASDVAGLRAQDGAMSYVLAETWTSVDPRFTIEPLEWPAGHLSGGVGVDRRDGRLFATDRTAHTVRAYDAQGGFTGTIGGPGTAGGRFDAPRDVAVLPDGRLAVSDTGNDRVQIVGADGAFGTAWPVDDPQGIVSVDDPAAGAIFVVSRAADRIEGYDEAGGQVELLALPAGSGAEGLAFTEAPSVNDGGRIRRLARFAVALSGDDVVIDLFARQPTPLLALPGARAVALWWPPAAGPPRVGAPLYHWQTFAGAPGTGVVPVVGASTEQVAAVPFEDVTDIEIAPDGTLFAAVAPEGLVSLGIGPKLLPWLTGLGKLASPARIAAGSDAVIADRWPRVQRWSLGGAPLTSLPLPLVDAGTVRAVDVAAAGPHRYALSSDGVVRAIGDDAVTASWHPRLGTWGAPIAIDAHGDDLAVFDLARQQVDVLTPALEPADWWAIAPPPGAFRYVVDIALSAENVFLADGEASAIEVRERGGEAMAPIPVPHGVTRVAAHPDGTVLALTDVGWVFAYDPDGTPRGAWPVLGEAGDGEAGDGTPTDLALDDAGRLYVTDSADTIRVYDRDDSRPALAPPPPERDRCRLTRDKRAAPPVVDLGDEVEVTLEISGTCTAEGRLADVVLAIDVSGSMGVAGKHVAAKNAAISFVAQMDPRSTRVAVVAFSTNATLTQPLTDDRAAVIARIGALPVDGGTNIPQALDVSLGALTAEPPRPGAARAIVLLTDGRSTQGALDASIDAVRAAGIDVYTVGLGRDADRATLARIATDAAHAFFSPTIDELTTLYAEIGRQIWQPDLLTDVALVDRVPANMTYIAGSAVPVEPAVAPGGRTLTWSSGMLSGARGLVVRYRVRPEQTGRWPTNIEAHADVVDGLGHAARVVFPVPRVTVRGIGPIFIPLALRESCQPALRPNAIALVLDASGSMRDRVPGGGTKLDAARAAARAFIDVTDLTRDRVAIVSFNASAALLQPLTGDRAALLDALARIRTAPGTGIAGGIDVAHGELAGPNQREDDHRVIVLLTDGRSNPEPPALAVGRAAAARAAGVTIFTIGLGADVDTPTLHAIAGTPEQHYASPDGSDLVDIYHRIARLLPCPPSRYWGGR